MDIEQPVLAVAKRCFAVACTNHSKHFIVIIDRKGRTKKFPRPANLISQTMSDDGAHLFLPCQAWISNQKILTTTTVLDTRSGRNFNFSGWVVSSTTQFLSYATPNREVHQMYFSIHKDVIDTDATSRFQGLMYLRDHTLSDPNSWSREELSKDGSSVRGLEPQIYFSNNLRCMIQLEHREIPRPTSENLDEGMNQRSASSLFRLGAGMCWSVEHREWAPLEGVSILNELGDFQFVTFEHVRMGSRKFKTYAIGIYRVSPSSGRVERVPLPKSTKAYYSNTALASF